MGARVTLSNEKSTGAPGALFNEPEVASCGKVDTFAPGLLVNGRDSCVGCASEEGAVDLAGTPFPKVEETKEVVEVVFLAVWTT